MSVILNVRQFRNVRQFGMSDVERLLNVGLDFGRRFVERHEELSPEK